MAPPKAFLLRINPEVFAALQGWAGDELRSVNGQIEYLLRRALQEAGRLPPGGAGEPAGRRGRGTSRGRRGAEN